MINTRVVQMDLYKDIHLSYNVCFLLAIYCTSDETFRHEHEDQTFLQLLTILMNKSYLSFCCDDFQAAVDVYQALESR